jgi:tRNA dimethylallyltransferase
VSADGRAAPAHRIILGPTAAGKSAIAMYLAERYNLAILSADSRQVYRRFDIGTAKPSVTDLSRVPHYGVNVADPTERYSAHRWADDANRWGSEARRSGRAPLIVGGTGFYVRALVEPLDAVPQLDEDRRAALAIWLDTLDADSVERWCRRLDPARAALGRTQRLRAIETALLTGEPISVSMTAASVTRNPAGRDPAERPARYLVVDPGPVLAGRIEARVHAMVEQGWIEEVRALTKAVPLDAPAWQASGYAVVRDVVLGTRDREEAIQRLIIETRQYAKRQRTWNRHQLPDAQVTRLDSAAPDALERARAWWESQEDQDQ